jgi:cell division protein FtsW
MSAVVTNTPTTLPGSPSAVARLLAGRRKPDYWILAAVVGLVLIGIVMVYSASYAEALAERDDPSIYTLKQVQNILTGGVALLIFAIVPYNFWRRFSVPLGFTVLVALVLVIFAPEWLSPEINGAHRWLVEPIFWQPSEVAKLVLVLYVADWLSQQGQKVRDLTMGLIPFGIVMGVIAFLVMKEPDMGTTSVLMAIGVAMFFIAGAHPLQFLGGSALAAGVFYALMNVAASRQARFTAFLDPWSDPLGAGYHTTQSLMALGSGGVFGLGLGGGRAKFGWLPEQFTDTIFAVLGQEWGFIGAMIVLGLYLLFVWRGLRVASRARDSYGTLLATGITVWIGWQALVNIGSVSNSIPFTGVPLPFISYGGTSLTITMAAVGLLLNISRFAQAQSLPTLGIAGGNDGAAGGGLRARIAQTWRRNRPARRAPRS